MTKMFEVGDRVVVLKNKITKKKYIGTKAYVISPKEDDFLFRRMLMTMSGIPSIVLKMSDGEIQYITKRNACDIISKIQ